MLETQIITLVILLMFSAFFSGIETALVSISRVKVKALVKQKKKGAEALHRLKQQPHRLITTILIGNNVVNIAAASLATVIFTDIFGSSGFGIATGVMTLLILIFGEITPKTFAAQNMERVSLAVARPIELLSIALSPLVKLFSFVSTGVSRLFGSKEECGLSEEELRTTVIMGKEQGILSKEAAEIISNVLEFEETKVTQIMQPRNKMELVNGNHKLRSVLNHLVRSPYSRFPVYDKSPDDIIGILDVDDVLKAIKNKRLDIKTKRIARKPYFIPESKEIDDLLIEFDGKDTPMAIIVDEYSSVAGLVTLEDILEEIVGDIFDKSKKTLHHIKKIDNNTLLIDATAPIDEINKALNLDISASHFNTLGGFIQHKMQCIPSKGETIVLKNATIEIEKVTKKGIKSVKIKKHAQ